MTTDTTPGHEVFGTKPRSYIPASVIAAGLHEMSPASLRPDGSRPRHLFDVTTEEGRAAHDAFHADRAAWEALKDEAYARHLAAQGACEGMFGDGI